MADIPAQPAARVAFVDSGLGLVAYADALLTLRPDVALILSMDPDNMPYGPRPHDEVGALVLAAARATLAYEPDAIVVACNTASVHGLEALRAEFEPGIPVIGTVPAIRPAANAGGPVAVWATAATTSSDYLRGLVDAFAADIETLAVACHGLAEAIEAGDSDGIDRSIAAALAGTADDVRSLVLGCTHYGLVADRIQAAVGGHVSIFDSPVAVARQTLRRLGLETRPTAEPVPVEAVLLSGRRGDLPESLDVYAAGSRLRARAELREPVGPSRSEPSPAR